MSDILQKVKKRLIELKVPYEYVRLSERPNKKIVIRIKGKTIHFGQKQSQTYIEGASEQKRNAYRARSSKITNKKGEYTYLIPFTNNYLSYHILW
jgi:hypothetical protein